MGSRIAPPMGSIYTPTNPPPEKPQTRAPAVTFNRRDVSPPSNVYVQPDDLLIVQAVTAPLATVLTVNYRLLRADGTIQPSVQQFTIPGDGAVHTFTQQLAEGFILTVDCTSVTGANFNPPTYVQVGLARPGGAAPIPYSWFLAGPLFPTVALSFPAQGLRRPTDGQGTLVVIIGTAPGVGAEAQIVTPAGVQLRILSLTVTLVASAAVANRRFGLTSTFAGSPIHRSTATTDQTAGQTVAYDLDTYGGTLVVTSARMQVSLTSDMRLPASTVVRTSTTNLQAADQYGGMIVFTEQWIADF